MGSVNNEKKDLGQYKGLKKTATYKDNLAIYSFSYSSGGTRGNITCPIIQWKYHGGITAGNVSAFLNCSFEKVIVLDKLKNLYLLIGHEKGDGSCNESIAYVISIDKNELNLQYKAFEDHSYLKICNGEFTYDEVKKTLNFKLKDKTNKENLSDKFDPESNIYNAISSEYYTNKKFSLTFNGKIFQ